ncbi:MAG: hydroxymethylpyrimidine/phosphomethylpyrimidine kinase [Myxococcota bacterium]|nr:hydroxymethylpyrimidine/phosphomethylpyrimidine kinase [Myxococcota bacterium]
MSSPPVALTIAGSDSSAGAGIQADLRVFHALGLVGASAITAVTVQDSQRVHRIHPVPTDVVLDQVRVVLADMRPAVIKIGMLGQGELAGELGALLSTTGIPTVWDPVLKSSSGQDLVAGEVTSFGTLADCCVLLTPNVQEVEHAGWVGRTAASTLVTGQRVEGGFRDRLYSPQGVEVAGWTRPFVQTRNDHGTGCTLSSAIAAYLALGAPLERACGLAGDRVNAWLQESAKFQVGEGRGGMQHGLGSLGLET